MGTSRRQSIINQLNEIVYNLSLSLKLPFTRYDLQRGSYQIPTQTTRNAITDAVSPSNTKRKLHEDSASYKCGELKYPKKVLIESRVKITNTRVRKP